MLHSEKPLPSAVTHNDELAQAILIELRGMRDDMDARHCDSAVARANQGEALVKQLRGVGINFVGAPPSGAPLVELREPAADSGASSLLDILRQPGPAATVATPPAPDKPKRGR